MKGYLDLYQPAGPGASDEQASIARCQVAWSTPGGGPTAGPGAAGTPCSLKQCAKPPWPAGGTEVDDCCGGGVLDEHAASSPVMAKPAANAINRT